MYKCKELNTEFESKKELFSALRTNQKDILAVKKAVIYNSKRGENKGAVDVIPITKSVGDSETKGFEIDDDYYYIAVNTTNILDSHEDVSINGSWTKTAKEQQGNVYLIFNHDYDPQKTIVKKGDIEMFVASIPFSYLKKPYEGNTEALIYKFRKDKVISKLAKDWLESGDDIEASVRLRYVKLVYAANSDDTEDKEFKRNFDKYYPLIANKDDFKEVLYFYAILEQQNILESSLVLSGSNPATGPIEENKKGEPLKSTQIKEEPSDDTRRDIKKNLLLNISKNY